ncbi:MAG: hypothetical protein ABI763_00685 [Bacteroidota bacterium]
MYKREDGSLCFGRNSLDKFFDYHSETLTGELVLMSDKYIETKLKENDFLDQYKNDKLTREAKDNIDEYRTKVFHKYIKYFNLLNEKMKG